jgi:hypothetical protein
MFNTARGADPDFSLWDTSSVIQTARMFYNNIDARLGASGK